MKLETGASNRFSISSPGSAPSQSDFSDSGVSSRRQSMTDGEVDPAEAQRKHDEFERRRHEHYMMKEALEKARELVAQESDGNIE